MASSRSSTALSATRARSALNTGHKSQKSATKTTPRASTALERSSQNKKPSNRLNPKTVDPFNKKGSKSVFASAYSKDGIPCRLVHGSVKHKIQWTVSLEDLDYDPLLVTFAEGLRETIHPYAFVANEGFIQMLMVDDAEERTLPVLSRLITPIKMALMSADGECFLSTMNALVELSNVVTSALNPHLKNLLPQISRRMSSKQTKECILVSLQKIECNGGSECTSIIKSRIPTYSSVL